MKDTKDWTTKISEEMQNVPTPTQSPMFQMTANKTPGIGMTYDESATRHTRIDVLEVLAKVYEGKALQAWALIQEAEKLVNWVLYGMA